MASEKELIYVNGDPEVDILGWCVQIYGFSSFKWKEIHRDRMR